MAGDPALVSFSANTESGLDLFKSDFSNAYGLDVGSSNIASGLAMGAGVRYGMSPIPGHSNKDLLTPVPNISKEAGLRASEETGNEALRFVDRRRFYGVVPVAIGAYGDLNVKGNLFIWLIADQENGVDTVLNAVSNSEYNATGANPFYTYQFDIACGFTNNLWAQMEDPGFGSLTEYLSPLISKLASPSNNGDPASTWTQKYLKVQDDLFYLSSAVLAVSGNKVPQPWMIGRPLSPSTATDTAPANFIAGNNNIYNATTIDTRFCPWGISPSWNLGDYTKNNRDLTFWNLSLIIDGVNSGIRLMRKYVYSLYPVEAGTYLPSFNQDNTNPNFALTVPSSLQIDNAAATPYDPGSELHVLLNDPAGFCDSSYRIVLVAAKKAYGFFVQDWQRDVEGRNVQVAPIIDRLHKPLTQTTAAFESATPAYYAENNVQVSTCFNNWPVLSGETRKYSEVTWDPFPVCHVSLGAQDSGVLRKNTVYEITYSVYDKQLGIETNVGVPAKIMTGDEDFVALSLYIDGNQGTLEAPIWQQYSPASQGQLPVSDSNWQVGANSAISWANYLELRFYYREIGSYDFLPALFIDAVKYWYYPDHQVLWACEGNIAGLPGGQPGAFNDYSFLPDEQYTCVVNYKSRAFWFSQNSAIFSLRNNPFAYPLRNGTPAPTGGFKGAIVHTYRGQSEQESRLVIFGQKETYIGKFTGALQQLPVVVSPDTIATFDVDGSDFNVETWTSITSFSHRSAVVADGDLYWWGPQGIYYDNGVGNPVKISNNLEQDIFNIYDEALTDEIHCVYDEKTKLIWWFYPPKGNNTISHAVVYNVDSEQFFPEVFDCKVDAAERIQTNNTLVTQDTNTLRTILSIRKSRADSLQRGVFFDAINRSGDYVPGQELLVKTIGAGVSSHERILTFDTGYNPAAFASIITGDYLALQQFERYTAAPASDLIAKVVSTNTMTGQIVINVPDGALLPTTQVPLDQRFFFPVWHAGVNGLTRGLNGIPWTILSKYWMVNTPNYSAIFDWMYLFFKYTPWAKVDPNYFNLAYRTPSGGPFISDRVKFVNNSDFNCQVFHAFRQGFENNQGQAIKFALSGIHIGDEWVLQYLELQTREYQGLVNKRYQG